MTRKPIPPIRGKDIILLAISAAPLIIVTGLMLLFCTDKLK